MATDSATDTTKINTFTTTGRGDYRFFDTSVENWCQRVFSPEHRWSNSLRCKKQQKNIHHGISNITPQLHQPSKFQLPWFFFSVSLRIVTESFLVSVFDLFFTASLRGCCFFLSFFSTRLFFFFFFFIPLLSRAFFFFLSFLLLLTNALVWQRSAMWSVKTNT